MLRFLFLLLAFTVLLPGQVSRRILIQGTAGFSCPANANTGQIWFDSATEAMRLCQDGVISPIATTTGVQTLTNKTIAGGLATTTHPAGANKISLLYHADDCTAITDGVDGEICAQRDTRVFYICTPSAGGCDTPAEWIKYLLLTEADLPSEAMTTSRNDFTFGANQNQACIQWDWLFSASGTLSADFCDDLVDFGTAQLKVGSLVVQGSGTPGPTGFYETRFLPFGTNFDTDEPLLGRMDGVIAKEIVKMSCITEGGGTESITLNFTRNGVAILTANLAADNGGQSTCNSSYDTCDVDTIDADEKIVEPGDVLGYDYVSEANSPTHLSCTLVWKEVAVP